MPFLARPPTGPFPSSYALSHTEGRAQGTAPIAASRGSPIRWRPRAACEEADPVIRDVASELSLHPSRTEHPVMRDSGRGVRILSRTRHEKPPRAGRWASQARQGG